MHYPHIIVLGTGFFLLAAVFIKCLHYKQLISTFHYKYSQRNYAYRIYFIGGFTVSHMGQHAD